MFNNRVLRGDRVLNWRLIGSGLAVVTLALDALSKAVVLEHFTDGPPVALTTFLNISLTFNRGMSYGIFNRGQVPPWLWFAVAVALSLGLGVWLWRSQGRLIPIALGLIVGGALGNAVDRLTYGAVVDFLDVHALGWHFWTFNIADAAISLGAVLLLSDGLFRRAD